MPQQIKVIKTKRPDIKPAIPCDHESKIVAKNVMITPSQLLRLN